MLITQAAMVAALLARLACEGAGAKLEKGESSGGGTAPAPESALDMPADRFLLTVYFIAKSGLEFSREDFQPGWVNPQLAYGIYAALMDLKDPKTLTTGDGFGVRYCVLVGESLVKAGYERLFIPGGKQNTEKFGKLYTVTSDGLTPWMYCNHAHMPDDDLIGPVGWPCTGGGSVSVLAGPPAAQPADIKRCMVFFIPIPEAHGHILRGKDLEAGVHIINAKTRMFELVKDWCLDRQPESVQSPLNLTKLSHCIYGAYASDSFNDQLKVERLPRVKTKLKGVAVLPSYAAGDDIGFKAPGGGMLMSTVPRLGPPDNGLRYHLLIVAAPNVLSH